MTALICDSLCADLGGTCGCSSSAGPPYTCSLNLALHRYVLEEQIKNIQYVQDDLKLEHKSSWIPPARVHVAESNQRTRTVLQWLKRPPVVCRCPWIFTTLADANSGGTPALLIELATGTAENAASPDPLHHLSPASRRAPDFK